MFHDYAPVFIIGMLNSFAEKTENGIIDFDTYVTDPEKYDGFLIYDKSNGKVVCDMCVDELHSDIVGYFDFFDGVDIRVSPLRIIALRDFRFTAIQKTARPILRITRLPIRGAAFPCRGKVHPSVRERLKIHDCQVWKTKSSVCVSRI